MDKLTVENSQDEEFNRSLLKAIAEASPDGILVVDRDSNVVSHNRRFLEIWNIPDEGLQPDGVLAEASLLHVALEQLKDPDAFLARLEELYENPSAVDETELELKDGRTLARHSSGLFDDADRYLGRVWFFRDITWRKQAEADLQQRANEDPLTRVMNRGYFYERGAIEVDRARRHNLPLSILMLDLDHFKAVNDHYGHATGDDVLVTACRRWKEALRSSDLLGRIGGEEFAILLPETDVHSGAVVAERLRQAMSRQKIVIDNQSLQCSVSIGVTQFQAGDTSIEDALLRADEVLYQAKANGRNRVEIDALKTD